MTTTSVESAAADATNPHHDRRWFILAVLGLAQLVVVLDTTVVTIALPTAQDALGFSDANRQWIITAYSLALGSLLLLGGRLCDLLGSKRIFLIGVAGFALASAVGGAATGFAMLVSARAAQGVFAALLAPAVLSLLTTTFTEPRERAKAFGVFGAVGGGGAAVGLLLGGALTEYLSWRWTMYINLIFAALAYAGGAILLRERSAADRPKLDMPGAVTVSAALFAIVYGFSHAATAGWDDAITIAFLAAGVVLLAVFFYLQARGPHPLVPLRILTDRNRAGGYLAILLSGAAMFSVFVFLTYFMQQSLGYSAVMTGLAYLPMVSVLMLMSTVGNTLLSTRVGPRYLIGGAMLTAGLGLALLTGIDSSSSYLVDVLPATLVIALGTGLIYAVAPSVATARVDPADAGVASALVNTGQQVGGSISTALLNTLVASAAAGYVASHGGTATAAVAADAAIHGYVIAFWCSAAVFAVGAVLCGLLLSPKVPVAEAS